MDFRNVRVAGHEANYPERLFLEVWFSVQDLQSGNDHIAIPEVYVQIFGMHTSLTLRFQETSRVFSSARAQRAVIGITPINIIFQPMKA